MKGARGNTCLLPTCCRIEAGAMGPIEGLREDRFQFWKWSNAAAGLGSSDARRLAIASESLGGKAFWVVGRQFAEGIEVFFDGPIEQVVKSHKAHAADREDDQEVFLLVVPR